MSTARPASRQFTALLRAAHIGPALAVTVVAALLAVSSSTETRYAVVVVTAVLAGQLTIGWGNDLLDAGRDRAVGRRDKPLANGELSPRLVATCVALSALVCLGLAFLAGWRSGVVHVFLGVAAGHAYNLGLKATVWSWLPYASAFGTLPAVVTLAGETPTWPPGWMLATAAALGVAAHLLNALPDLQDDERTGVRGLPHALGATRSRVLATSLLVAGSAAAVLGPPGAPPAWIAGAFVIVVILGAVACVTSGRTPFRAAVTIVLADVVLLLAAGG